MSIRNEMVKINGNGSMSCDEAEEKILNKEKKKSRKSHNVCQRGKKFHFGWYRRVEQSARNSNGETYRKERRMRSLREARIAAMKNMDQVLLTRDADDCI